MELFRSLASSFKAALVVGMLHVEQQAHTEYNKQLPASAVSEQGDVHMADSTQPSMTPSPATSPKSGIQAVIDDLSYHPNVHPDIMAPTLPSLPVSDDRPSSVGTETVRVRHGSRQIFLTAHASDSSAGSGYLVGQKSVIGKDAFTLTGLTDPNAPGTSSFLANFEIHDTFQGPRKKRRRQALSCAECRRYVLDHIMRMVFPST